MKVVYPRVLNVLASDASSPEERLLETCFLRQNDNGISLLMPLSLMPVRNCQLARQSLANRVRSHLDSRDQVQYLCWNEAASDVFRDMDFSQPARVVLSCSRVFWEDDSVSIKVDPEVLNFALGKGVAEEFRDAVSNVTRGAASVVVLE